VKANKGPRDTYSSADFPTRSLLPTDWLGFGAQYRQAPKFEAMPRCGVGFFNFLGITGGSVLDLLRVSQQPPTELAPFL